MNHTIQLTAEQFQALQSGQPITIEPPKPAITKWEPPKPTITKWEPKPGLFTIDLISLVSYEAKSNYRYRLAGVEYSTKAQANSAAKQLRAYARQLAWLAENDDGWAADWNDCNQYKHYIYIEHSSNKIKPYKNYTDQSIGIIYMSEANATKLAQLMNDGIVEF